MEETKTLWGEISGPANTFMCETVIDLFLTVRGYAIARIIVRQTACQLSQAHGRKKAL